MFAPTATTAMAADVTVFMLGFPMDITDTMLIMNTLYRRGTNDSILSAPSAAANFCVNSSSTTKSGFAASTRQKGRITMVESLMRKESACEASVFLFPDHNSEITGRVITVNDDVKNHITWDVESAAW